MVSEILALQEQMNLPKRRPVGLVPLPALAHQIVYLLRTVDWRAQQDLEQIAGMKIGKTRKLGSGRARYTI